MSGPERGFNPATGRSEALFSSYGARLMASLPGGVAHIRESITLGTSAETFDFSANPIVAAAIYCLPIATVTAEFNSAVVCIDPPNAAVRDAWLTAADSLASDTHRIPVTWYYPLELTFVDAAGALSPISYIGAKVDIGTDQEIRMIIVGIEL